ncbi:MAG: amino acid ABC transporter substrate-binding protein [Spiribacter sp.]|nr:amino acid ABC transporter substrate-binding protein [Spiribacter sp.]MDR9490150.1 amino acid ABC transporter substrate-binding protein [Spiribacter sp.]
MRFNRLQIGFLTVALAMIPLGNAFAQSSSQVLARIAEDGVINVGHRESSVPFAYIGDDGEPIGFSIDLCLNIVEAVEDEIGMDVEINWVAVNPQTRIPLMANGTIDLECGSTTNKLSRQEQVDYAYTTFITGTKILTKRDSGINSVDDLAGKAIALAQGTTNERAIKAAIEQRNISDVSIQSVRDHSEGFLALETDRVDAYSTDDVLLFGLIDKARNPDDYAVVGEFLSYDPYALMVPKDDSDYRLLVNRTLVGLFSSGEFHEIYDKWFEPLSIPMSSMLQTAVDIQTFPE